MSAARHVVGWGLLFKNVDGESRLEGPYDHSYAEHLRRKARMHDTLLGIAERVDVVALVTAFGVSRIEDDE